MVSLLQAQRVAGGEAYKAPLSKDPYPSTFSYTPVGNIQLIRQPTQELEIFRLLYGDIDPICDPKDPNKLSSAKALQWIKGKFADLFKNVFVNIFPSTAPRPAIQQGNQQILPTQIEDTPYRQLCYYLQNYTKFKAQELNIDHYQPYLYEMLNRVKGIEVIDEGLIPHTPDAIIFDSRERTEAGNDPFGYLRSKQWAPIDATKLSHGDIVAYFNDNPEHQPNSNSPVRSWGVVTRVVGGVPWTRSIWDNHVVDHVCTLALPDHGDSLIGLHHQLRSQL